MKNFLITLLFLSCTLGKAQVKLDMKGVQEVKSEVVTQQDVDEVVEEPKGLVSSPTVEEAELPDKQKELEEAVKILAAPGLESQVDGQVGERSKSLRIYAILLILLVTIIMGLASLFSSNSKDVTQ